MSIEIRPVKPCDYKVIKKMELRDLDVQEVMAVRPDLTISEALMDAVSCPNSWIGFKDGKPGAVWGCVPGDDSMGIIWCLGTNDIYTIIPEFNAFVKMMLETWSKQFAVLGNQVDARNKPAIKWLKGLGFEFADLPHDVNGHDFYWFFMRGYNV
jgi:hypothetical protein